MNTVSGIACLGLTLVFVTPAVCGSQATLIGKWQTASPDTHGLSLIFDFKANGTVAYSMRQGGKVTPLKSRDGQPLLLGYTVSGNELKIGAANRLFEECFFKVQSDTLRILKAITVNGRRPGQMQGLTFTRVKG